MKRTIGFMFTTFSIAKTPAYMMKHQGNFVAFISFLYN